MHLKPGTTEGKATLYAICVGLYPVHWFFTFLYYTDVASLAAVLAMYLACLKKNFWFSAMVSSVGINRYETHGLVPIVTGSVQSLFHDPLLTIHGI